MSEKVKYYDIRDDFARCPGAWCYLIWSKRGPGKTYSTLRYMVEEEKKFLFLKRTIEDIKTLTMTPRNTDISFDVSPFVPLNRDFGWNIKPVLIRKGFAGFYYCNEEGNPAGKPIGYAAALSAAADIKGFDLSECDYLVFDEFIPKRHERINRKEGEALLEIYMTVRRDRKLRGREDLKLICLANATSVNNPVFNTLDVVDKAVNMDINNMEFLYLQKRGIFLHMINNEYAVEEEASGIELAMSGTAWADMAFGGHFSFDDFTSVKRHNLKGYSPVCCYRYQKKKVYIYHKDGYYYASYSKANKNVPEYNLDRENEQKKFYLDHVIDMREDCIEDRFLFEEYSMYDLIINYRKIFDL